MKKELRQEMLRHLKAQNRFQKEQADRFLVRLLQESIAYQRAKTLATYLSFDHEFSTASLIETAQLDGKRVCIPKVYPHGQMEFYEYNPENLEKVAFGLLEPGAGASLVGKDEIDLIHVPGLVFNAARYRIGYGGGYYDRYLTDFKGHTVSTIYAFQQREFESEPYDISVEEVLVYEDNFG